ncbi:MAG: low molecular weight protein-tyrosine-phosphatase [Prevotella sp.]|nr:low molecular weight protein-tyrosine-phosphatase [Prevotella sp.]
MKQQDISLLFICLGNICRSPAAEGVMKHMIEQSDLPFDIAVDSAGIGGWHAGELPDRRMRSRAQLRGYTLDSRARQFQKADFDRFDYLIVMDEENYREISSRANSTEMKEKVLRMRDFFRQYKGQKTVPDPYYGDENDFDFALDLIEDGCKGLLERLTGK